MRLIEDKNEIPAQNGTNGNGVHSDNGSASDSKSEEEAEPVSATLVLRIIAEHSSPDVSRKSSSVQDQHLADQNGGSTGGTFLQVQVQRSISNSSKPQNHPRSRTPSFNVADTEERGSYLTGRQSQLSGSRASTISPSPSSQIELYRHNGLNSVDLMDQVSAQTKRIQEGLKALRGEVDNPLRVLDIGQEAIVLSGLSRSAGESLKNIKNLYDETKYLKSYLEKLEASVQNEIEEQKRKTSQPDWVRRFLFISVVVCTGAVAWRKFDPNSFERSAFQLGASANMFFSKTVNLFTNNQNSVQDGAFIHK